MVIEFRAYIYASGADEFYDKQTQLLIDILKEIEKHPVEHALATQRMILESPDEEKSTAKEKMVSVIDTTKDSDSYVGPD